MEFQETRKKRIRDQASCLLPMTGASTLSSRQCSLSSQKLSVRPKSARMIEPLGHKVPRVRFVAEAAIQFERPVIIPRDF
jgi:hypothetical protein